MVSGTLLTTSITTKEHPCLQDGSLTTAYTYIWQEHLYSALYGSWDYQEFREEHLQSYVQMSANFAEDYRAASVGDRKVGGAKARGGDADAEHSRLQ